MTWLFVALAGGFGAVVRLCLDRMVERTLRRRTSAGIVIVNLFGSFVLGAIVGASVHASGATPLPALSPTTYAMLTTGFCGGFTTFSTAMADTFQMFATNRVGLAFFHLFGTFAGAVVCCQVGYAFFA